MPVTVRTFFSESEIYGSGAITVRDLQPLTIQIIPVTGNPYDIRLIFSRLEGQEGSVQWTVAESGGINITIVNFDSTYGLTPYGPINVGYYEGREILLDFIIYTLGHEPRTSPKLFCYTLRAGNLADG
jgi:hypothetical protein